MKNIPIILLVVLLVACASKPTKVPGTNLIEKAFDLNIEQRARSTRSFDQLDRDVTALNTYIGSYPPRFESEAEREEIYLKWLDLAADAEAYAATAPDEERSLFILSEVYRQGHNMDVVGSAEKSVKNIESCLSTYPKSIPCNFTASYLYLSIGPQYFDLGEKSLNTLKMQYAPRMHPEVEAGYVFLYLFRQDVPKAKAQIDKYIENFPDHHRVKDFTIIKANLGDKIEKIDNW